MLYRSLVALALLPALAHAQGVDKPDGPPVQNPSTQRAGDLGVQIVLTADATAFRNTWDPSAATRRLQSPRSIRRGVSLSAMAIVHGCTANASGNCDAEISFAIVLPDGTTMPAGKGPLWTQAPSPGRMLLSDAGVQVSFDEKDPSGVYKVRAKATDKVSGKEIEVSAPFTLQ